MVKPSGHPLLVCECVCPEDVQTKYTNIKRTAQENIYQYKRNEETMMSKQIPIKFTEKERRKEKKN